MVSRAVARYIRISPRKTRLVANYVKGKSVAEALGILANLNKKACVYIEEALRSAIANAKRSPEISEEDLFISKLTVDCGPALKRFRAASMGRAVMIKHRMSHINVELDITARAKAKKDIPKTKSKKAQAIKRKKER